MSYVKSFPKKYHGTAWLFRVIARYQFTNPLHGDHPESCRCEGCFLGPKGQLELKL